MFAQRTALYEELQEKRGSFVLTYFVGDRRGLEIQMHPEVLDQFVDHLDRLPDKRKISLYLYAPGGVTLTAWSIVNLIRQFSDSFEVIIPAKAHSAATLLCLGANKLVMTKQATLGPIDPSVNTPLNPAIPGAPMQARVPVSVEAIRGFLDLAMEEAKLEGSDMKDVLCKLVDNVHPLVLGQVYRTRAQIRMLAERLLANQGLEPIKVARIVDFLCSESGSHDYTINRSEAKALGLNVEKPDDDLYKLIKKIYDDLRDETEMNKPFDPERMLQGQNEEKYEFRRGVVESIAGGCDVFMSEGVLRRVQVTVAPGVVQPGINDARNFEGWRHL
jgi:hypothetical protein